MHNNIMHVHYRDIVWYTGQLYNSLFAVGRLVSPIKICSSPNLIQIHVWYSIGYQERWGTKIVHSVVR